MGDMHFTSFTTVFQSYQDDERNIMKVCVKWNPVYCREDFALSGLELGTARSVGQRLTHWATGAQWLLLLAFSYVIHVVVATNTGQRMEMTTFSD